MNEQQLLDKLEELTNDLASIPFFAEDPASVKERRRLHAEWDSVYAQIRELSAEMPQIQEVE